MQEHVRWPVGPLSNGCDREMPTRWNTLRTCSQVVSEVTRAATLPSPVARCLRLPTRALRRTRVAALSARVLIWPPCCLIDRAEFPLLSCPIQSVTYQFTCALLHTQTATILWSISFVAFPYFYYNFSFRVRSDVNTSFLHAAIFGTPLNISQLGAFYFPSPGTSPDIKIRRPETTLMPRALVK